MICHLISTTTATTHAYRTWLWWHRGLLLFERDLRLLEARHELR
jgi:hypothetical protein